jgi:pSer/pThr/pTyr-binding forkhead associated (FHA) protein
VNGERIVGKCSLAAEDSIQIGDYLIGLESKANPDLQPQAETVVTQIPDAITSADDTLPLDQAARLVVVSSNLAGQEYALCQREMVVGRHAQDANDLTINHRSISRNHAKLIWRDNRFTVIDLGSANGVIVNGQAMTTTSLVNGDIIEMGHVKLRFCGPGDEYVFSISDIDDVILPPANQLLRYALMAVVLLGMILIGYILADALRDDPAEQGANTPAVTSPSDFPVSTMAEESSVPSSSKSVRVMPKQDFSAALIAG